MKIKGPAHADAVLGALVKQAEQLEASASKGPWKSEDLHSPDVIDANGENVFVSAESFADCEFVAASRSFTPALVQGVKAVLKEHEENKKVLDDSKHPASKDHWQAKVDTSECIVLLLAEAYVPWMIEAGMTVPE